MMADSKPNADIQEASQPCPRCNGVGSYREFSTIPTILALAGFGSCGYVVVQRLTSVPPQPIPYKGVLVLCGIGIIGLYALLDRARCSDCEGTGREGGKEDDDYDDYGGEWDTGKPPE
jgi:hypothetical protein